LTTIINTIKKDEKGKESIDEIIIFFPKRVVRAYLLIKPCWKCEKLTTIIIVSEEYVSPLSKSWSLDYRFFVSWDNPLRKRVVDKIKLQNKKMLFNYQNKNFCVNCKAIQDDWYVIREFYSRKEDWSTKCIYEESIPFSEQELKKLRKVDFVDIIKIIKTKKGGENIKIIKCPHCSKMLETNQNAKIAKNQNYALVSKKNHSLSINNDLWLCKSCHMLVDPNTENLRRQRIPSLCNTNNSDCKRTLFDYL